MKRSLRNVKQNELHVVANGYTLKADRVKLRTSKSARALCFLLLQKYEQGFILDPVVMAPESTVADVMAVKKQHGYCGTPITENGKLGGKLVGLVTLRDIDFLPASDYNLPVREVS